MERLLALLFTVTVLAEALTFSLSAVLIHLFF